MNLIWPTGIALRGGLSIWAVGFAAGVGIPIINFGCSIANEEAGAIDSSTNP